jgi:hypothetical protein
MRNHRLVLLGVFVYFVFVGAALGVLGLTFWALGHWPPAWLRTASGRGFLTGIVAMGWAWWCWAIVHLFDDEAERDRKGAEGEESTGHALRPLRRHGWTVIHDLEYPGLGNVDHVIVGPGGVIAIDSKFTTERLSVTAKAIRGSRRGHISEAKYAAHLAERALGCAGFEAVDVEPALVFWGPGAPSIPDGHIVIQDTLVLEGRKSRSWRSALSSRRPRLDVQTVEAVVAALLESTTANKERPPKSLGEEPSVPIIEDDKKHDAAPDPRPDGRGGRGSSEGQTAYDAVAAQLGFVAVGRHRRFTRPGWFYAGPAPARCPECTGVLDGFRCPYVNSAGVEYHYWALACIHCEHIWAPSDLQADDRAALYQASEHRPIAS